MQPLQILWHSFVQPCLMNHPFRLIRSFYTFINEESVTQRKFIEIGSASLLVQPYKVLLSLINFYAAVIFFSLFIYLHTLQGLA